MVGARREVKDVKSNKEIQDLGRFSVSEFNAKLGDDKQKEQLLLNFQEVVEAQTQVVSGIKYYLKILAAPLHNSNEKQLYDAAVVVKPWLNRGSLTLLHFRPSCTATTKAAV
ncbi:Cysteine proteinase inhibitor 10 [Linum grandiflorum]